MSISIEDYVCNLIAGKSKIVELYRAVDRARYCVSNGLKSCYKANFSGIGSKMYKEIELVSLDKKAFCNSISDLILEITPPPTLNQYIILLLKGRTEIEKIYNELTRALYMRSHAKIFTFRFTNVYGPYANLDRNYIIYNDATKYLTMFCECQQNTFNPLLVFIRLFSFDADE